MKSLADEIFDMALSMNRIAAIQHGAPQTIEKGSPDALADCRRRLHEATRKAQRLIDDPRFGPAGPTYSHEWADHEATFHELPAEYDTDSEGDENDGD